MHKAAYEAMDGMLNRVAWPRAKVLDVGSLDINGSFRPLCEQRGWIYLGLDVVPGKNVDVVASPFSYPFENGDFDIVISGSTMEHVTAVWRWIPELARVLRPGGLLALTTHMAFPEHRHPVDCWRVLPDGIRYLFDETGVLERYDIVTNTTDIYASALRKE